MFADRYHDVVLRTPRQVRNALCYVLHNAKKHKLQLADELDPYSSGPWFRDWREKVTVRGLEAHDVPVASAHTWLLDVGWKRARSPGGLVSVYETPG